MKKILLSVGISVTSGVLAAWLGMFRFLFSSNYLPHQFCYLAQPWLVWTNVTTDGLIAISYLALFLGLFWLAYKVRDLEEMKGYLWIFFAFGTFILTCGLTHVMEIVTVWWPVYRLAAAMKVVCAVASVGTAIFFVRVVPLLAGTMERFIVMLSTTQQEKDQALSSLIAAEKLAVAGRISASIAHEIKNPLDAVGNLLYLVRTGTDLPPESLSLIDTAEAEIVRAGHIARSTLSLYRESSAPASVALGPLLQSVIELQTTDLVRHNISIQPRVVAPVPLYAYPSEVRQILINLMQNSAAAIGRDGRILVRVQPRAGGYSITVADTGSGIEQENRARLFNLFFTTKGEHGTGLGLWLVQSLVEKHGGSVRFRSRTAGESTLRGTVFNVWLPFEGPRYKASGAGAAARAGVLQRDAAAGARAVPRGIDVLRG